MADKTPVDTSKTQPTVREAQLEAALRDLTIKADDAYNNWESTKDILGAMRRLKRSSQAAQILLRDS